MNKFTITVFSLILILIVHSRVWAAAPSTPITAPSSSQLTAWFDPILSKIEAFRIQEAASYADLRDKTKEALGITEIKMPTAETDGLPPLKFDNPTQYLVLIYATACASFFGNSTIFYIGGILIILLALRFIVNFFT